MASLEQSFQSSSGFGEHVATALDTQGRNLLFNFLIRILVMLLNLDQMITYSHKSDTRSQSEPTVPCTEVQSPLHLYKGLNEDSGSSSAHFRTEVGPK